MRVRTADLGLTGAMPAHHVEIQLTCGSAEEADSIANALVERRLAACVQQLPIRSVYRWEGAIERADEVLLLAKTSRAQYLHIERLVLELHSYDVAAITCTELVTGSPSYLGWIDEATTT